MAVKKTNNQKLVKEAIKKFGKYATMTTIGTFIILNPKKKCIFTPVDPWDGRIILK